MSSLNVGKSLLLFFCSQSRIKKIMQKDAEVGRIAMAVPVIICILSHLHMCRISCMCLLQHRSEQLNTELLLAFHPSVPAAVLLLLSCSFSLRAPKHAGSFDLSVGTLLTCGMQYLLNVIYKLHFSIFLKQSFSEEVLYLTF